MRILIAGGSGFIGKNFTLKAPKDWEIFSLYNTSSNIDNFLFVNKLKNVKDPVNLYSVEVDIDTIPDTSSFFHQQESKKIYNQSWFRIGAFIIAAGIILLLLINYDSIYKYIIEI